MFKGNFDTQNRIWAMVDGFDVKCAKAGNNFLQTLTYSVKNGHNGIRFVLYGLPDGTPVKSLPKWGMSCSGRHSDNNSFDIFIIMNEDGINVIFPPEKTCFICDRGMLYIYSSCTLGTKGRNKNVFDFTNASIQVHLTHY